MAERILKEEFEVPVTGRSVGPTTFRQKVTVESIIFTILPVHHITGSSYIYTAAAVCNTAVQAVI